VKNQMTWALLTQAMDTIAERCGYSSLDRISQRLLEWISKTELEIPVIYVQTVIMKSGIASPATLHKSLAKLERQGFLATQVDKSDARRRIIITTKKSKTMFASLSREVVKTFGPS